MKVLRNIALAGTVAVAAALSAGTASAHHGHHGNHYGQSRLCYVPFFKLVQWFGYYQAKQIKYRCYYGYNYYGYNYGY